MFRSSLDQFMIDVISPIWVPVFGDISLTNAALYLILSTSFSGFSFTSVALFLCLLERTPENLVLFVILSFVFSLVCFCVFFFFVRPLFFFLYRRRGLDELFAPIPVLFFNRLTLYGCWFFGSLLLMFIGFSFSFFLHLASAFEFSFYLAFIQRAEMANGFFVYLETFTVFFITYPGLVGAVSFFIVFSPLFSKTTSSVLCPLGRR
jgi:hypothetical protein